MENFPNYLFGFIVSIVLIWILQPVAKKIGLVDKPGGRKKHLGRVPLIGGIAMMGGLVATLLSLDEPIGMVSGLLMGGALLLAVGTIDDIVSLSPFTRFLAQITAALIMITMSSVYLQDFGYLLGNETFSLGVWAIPVTVFATVGVINAINMSDGMDGLAGGLVLVALFGLGFFNVTSGTGQHTYLFLALITVVTAFLIFNIRTAWRSHAQIFMGNGGSMLLGFIIAWLLIYQTQGDQRAVSPVFALWILALPLLDTVCIMLRRIFKGRSPFAPDREHFHHILLVAGYSVNQSVWIILCLASLLAMMGVIGIYVDMPDMVMFIAFLALFAFYFWGMSHAWKVMKVIKREKSTGGGAVENVIKPVKSSEN